MTPKPLPQPRLQKPGRDPPLLPAWPAPRHSNWVAPVNESPGEQELEAVRL